MAVISVLRKMNNEPGLPPMTISKLLRYGLKNEDGGQIYRLFGLTSQPPFHVESLTFHKKTRRCGDLEETETTLNWTGAILALARVNPSCICTECVVVGFDWLCPTIRARIKVRPRTTNHPAYRIQIVHAPTVIYCVERSLLSPTQRRLSRW